jgi:hypothetical protein
MDNLLVRNEPAYRAALARNVEGKSVTKFRSNVGGTGKARIIGGI